MAIDFRVLAAELRDELVIRRRDFHMYPELGFEEFRTSGLVADELRKLGLEVQTQVGRTGVVGMLEGEHDGPTVLVRADMDALPIQELNTVDYISRVGGKMHACGHDAHMTIALGVAKILSRFRADIHGRVKFVFQPGEEGHGGALEMIKDGILKNPVPDVVLGLHVWAELPIGTIGVASGAVMSGSSVFRIVVEGKGGHAAMPYTTVDPVVCTGELIMALNTIVGRKMNAMDGAVVLSVTGVRTSSDAFNVIPQSVEIKGTFRTFNAYTSEIMEQHIRSVSTSVCASVGCEAKVTIKHLNIPVVNDVRVAKRVRKAMKQVVKASALDQTVRTMASEDVSFLLEQIPGMYFFVGMSNKAKGIIYGHHHPRFNIDEDVLPLSVALMSASVAEFVMQVK
ncbi:MAG: amidohydrolase [Chloroflexi bacterium]|nr:amidohydrolase [Chloroflexota bacterium]MCC6895532.1 amidohydrolase [Anaerolineae bacterium]